MKPHVLGKANTTSTFNNVYHWLLTKVLKGGKEEDNWRSLNPKPNVQDHQVYPKWSTRGFWQIFSPYFTIMIVGFRKMYIWGMRWGHLENIFPRYEVGLGLWEFHLHWFIMSIPKLISKGGNDFKCPTHIGYDFSFNCAWT